MLEKMKIVFCLLMLFVIMHNAYYVHGTCCRDSFKIEFAVKPDAAVFAGYCIRFNAKELDYNGKTCVIENACANGKPVAKGRHYCGIGECNPFGCDCEGGCISRMVFPSKTSIEPVDVANQFTAFHKYEVFNVKASKNPWYKM